MQIMNVSTFGSMKLGKPTTFTIPWGVTATPPEDPFREAEVRQLVEQEASSARSYVQIDNKAEGPYKDLDNQVGRVLVLHNSTKLPDLQGEAVEPAVSVRFDPTTKDLNSMDITSRDNNCSSHVLWKNGEFQSLREERVLADGRREVLDVSVNSGSGTLTLTTQVLDKV
jgi:hypothetical protein